MGVLHERIVLGVLVLVVIVGTVLVIKFCRAGKHAASQVTPTGRKQKKQADIEANQGNTFKKNSLNRALSQDPRFSQDLTADQKKENEADEATIAFVNHMFDGENKDPIKKKSSQQSKKNQTRITRHASMVTMEAEEQGNAKAKSQRAKERAKEKKGKPERDMSRLQATKEQFEQEIAVAKFEFESGNSGLRVENVSAIGAKFNKKGQEQADRVGEHKAKHKAKPVQRGGAGGLI